MVELKGKWALVTGASRGVGTQIAQGLAELGCNLVLHARTLEGTAELAKKLGGVEVRCVAGELSKEEDVHRVALETLRVSGGIDVLYNNAAVQSKYFSDPWAVSAEELRRCFEVDTVAPILICNALVPRMLERGFGRVVNLTSGIKDQPNLSPYAVAKAALDKYVRDFAPSLQGTGVTMNLLDPGWLRTDMGGPNAPGQVESVVPGALVPALLDDGVSGRWFNAQEYAGLSLAEAVQKA
jgi:NAD(P)-dependent dehydrogenase (short-subunit alcohol dehydrogenase family)